MAIESRFKNFSWYELLPSVDMEVCEENLDLFFRTMYERQEIWYRRFMLSQKRPWSEDPFMSNHKFTNVYRVLDRSSQWLVKNVLLDEYQGKLDLIWRIIVFRIFNLPETFEAVGLPRLKDYDQGEFLKKLDDYRKKGNKIFTDAYMINAAYCKGQERHVCYGNIFLPKLKELLNDIFIKIKRAERAKDPMIIIKALKQLPMVSDFLAHEFYQDFTYVPQYTAKILMKFDQDDYTNVGPGCSVGIRLIFPNCETISQQKEKIYELRHMADEFFSKNNLDFKYLHWNKENEHYYTDDRCNITLHQIEMWLCEFQKYWKMSVNLGKQRQKFSPKTKQLLI